MLHLNWNETIVILALIAAVTVYKVIALFVDAHTGERSCRAGHLEDDTDSGGGDLAAPAKSAAPGR